MPDETASHSVERCVSDDEEDDVLILPSPIVKVSIRLPHTTYKTLLYLSNVFYLSHLRFSQPMQ